MAHKEPSDAMSILPIPIGAVVTDKRYPGVRFLVDSHGRGEYGCTVARIGGTSVWALPSDVTEVCRCPQVSDGANGWRCQNPHKEGNQP